MIEGRTLRVLAPGLDAPVATIHCEVQCNMMHTFGPGQDEVTTLTGGSDPDWRQPLIAEVWGYDNTLRAEFDLSTVAGNGRGIADLEWSPDGSRLAVSTYQGQVEPDCPGERPTSPGAPTEAQIYLLDRTGGDPTLIHQQTPRQELDLRTPVLTELSWSPDGERLGLISSTYCHYQQLDSPRLLSLDVESGTAATLYRFDQTYTLMTLRTGSPGRRTGPASRLPAEPASPRSPRTGARSPRLAAAVKDPWPGSTSQPSEHPPPCRQLALSRARVLTPATEAMG